MARRPSTASLASSRTPLDALSVLSPLSVKLQLPPSGSIASSKSHGDAVDLDPDELFAKYTITEVKAKQAQLRAHAETKQEDLRIMVGERYRDLLQASSSITSIAMSAKRVQEALEETITTVRPQTAPIAQNHVSPSGKDDSHLQTLQVLSAHIKLLLDAPEHLWRLIEREKYLQAAWLFLLSRVVHQALIRDDVQDDASWTQHGVDILEQFPLVQRQWETVSHFRTQITHRATMSLRSYDKTSNETCATLLTLHILDSRPLPEILVIYLSQRSRTLNTLLAKSLGNLDQRNSGFSVDGDLQASQKFFERTGNISAKTTALAVRNAMRTVLETLSRTLYAAREIFGTYDSARSLAENALDRIQSEPSCIPSAALPAELLINTPAVLNSLPSAGYISLLPTDIRSYRPFVDLSSVSSSLPREALRDKLDNWFDQSTANFRGAFDKWLATLDVVSVVWKVRSSLRRWVVHSGLLAPEIVNLSELLDQVFHTRITNIWKAVLVRSEKEFLGALGSMETDIVDDMFSPLRNLYRSLPVIQLPPGAGPSSFDSGYHSYKMTLVQRLDGRAPRLHDALRTLEDAATLLEKDRTIMFADGASGEKLVVSLTSAYSPEAQALCASVTSTLKDSSEKLMAGSDLDAVMGRLIFCAHAAKELSISPFVRDIGCDQAVATSFREEMNALFQRIMSFWEAHVISKLMRYYTESTTIRQTDHGTTCLHASPPMMECLYLLSSSIHNLGMSHRQSYLMTAPQRMIAGFSAAFVRSIGHEGDLQALYDLSLLHHLASKWKSTETTGSEQAIDRLRLHLTGSAEHDPDPSASELVSRTQMLISALLPRIPESCEKDGDKLAGMLAFGVPVVDTQFVPAIDVAPPSSRFPLLLVDAR